MNTGPLVAAPTGQMRIAALDAGAASGIRLSLVIPTFNEAANIRQLVREIAAILDQAPGCTYEIIIVDDDSPDRTWELALGLVREVPALRVMRRTHERGLATAVIRGWQVARGDILAVIDGDLQHPPEILLALWTEIERGHEMAIASRHVEGGGVSKWALWRRVLSRGAQILGLLVLPGAVGRVSDPMSGYLMVRCVVVQGIDLNPLGYKILVELLGRCQPRSIAEVPYVFRERLAGQSKLTRGTFVDYLRHLLRLRLASFPVARFVRFACVGLSGVVVDMGFLYLLSDPASLGWGLTRSKLIAAELAIINNFIWNDAWTFRDLALAQTGWPQRARRFAKFQAICLAGLVLNTILLNLQFNVLGMNRYVANAVAIAVMTGWNFWLNLKLSWRVTTR
ncbi:MAG: glycosyltransferase [Steroidobacterales bacterium]